MNHSSKPTPFENKPIVQRILNELVSSLSSRYTYHSAQHALDVLREVILLAEHDAIGRREQELLAVAAAYHDSGYLEGALDHEERSALRARQAMLEEGGYSTEEVAVVEQMIRATHPERRSKAGLLGRYLLDADIGNIGRDDFFLAVERLIEEEHSDRAAALARALELVRRLRWQTPAAEALRENKRRENLARLTLLVDPTTVAVMQSREDVAHSLRDGQSVRIGRAADNDIVLRDTNVSRYHAVLSASLSGVVISDLASMNGTFLEGKRVAVPSAVPDGARLTVGENSFRIFLRRGIPSPLLTLGGTATVAGQLRSSPLTVVVADLEGYTAMSEGLPAATVTAMLNRWFQQTSEIVTQHEGVVDKFIGDCVMAVWLGSERTSCAEQALKAALEIGKQTDLMNHSWEHAAKYPWRCRTALNSGEALLGGVGGRDARDFTVLGDAVNVAFRLERLAKQYALPLLIAQTTAELLTPAFNLVEVDAVALEGRSAPLQVYRLA